MVKIYVNKFILIHVDKMKMVLSPNQLLLEITLRYMFLKILLISTMFLIVAPLYMILKEPDLGFQG